MKLSHISRFLGFAFMEHTRFRWPTASVLTSHTILSSEHPIIRLDTLCSAFLVWPGLAIRASGISESHCRLINVTAEDGVPVRFRIHATVCECVIHFDTVTQARRLRLQVIMHTYLRSPILNTNSHFCSCSSSESVIPCSLYATKQPG